MQSDKIIYATNTIEFVTVAVEFCAFIEKSSQRNKAEFMDVMLKLLPLLYLKTTTLSRVESNEGFIPDEQVTEEDYNWIASTIKQIMGEDDSYQDLFFDPQTQTEELEWKSVSEDLADMYQALRNFVAAYQMGVEDCMHDALWLVMDQFELFWGKSLTDALRQLHRIKVKQNLGSDFDEDTY